MSRTGTTVTKGTMAKEVEDALNEADKDWTKATVKHKQSHIIDDGGKKTTVPKDSNYVIAYDSTKDKVEGQWTNTTTE